MLSVLILFGQMLRYLSQRLLLPPQYNWGEYILFMLFKALKKYFFNRNVPFQWQCSSYSDWSTDHHFIFYRTQKVVMATAVLYSPLFSALIPFTMLIFLSVGFFFLLLLFFFFSGLAIPHLSTRHPLCFPPSCTPVAHSYVRWSAACLPSCS